MQRPSFVIGVMGALLIALSAHAQRGNGSDPQDPLAGALQQSNVYVGKTRRSTVDASALQALTDRAPADRPLKIAVVSELPSTGRQFGTRDAYTQALHKYLGLGRGTLLIETQHGVSAATDAVPGAQITQILRSHADQLQNDPVVGIRQAVAELDAAANGRSVASEGSSGVPNAASPDGDAGPQEQPMPGGGFDPWWLLLPVGVGGAALWVGSRAVKKRREMQEALIPVNRLRGEVVNGVTYADSYLDLLPASPEATAAREAREQAASLYEQAIQQVRRAQSVADYGRAQALLEQAKVQVDLCRQKIDVATGGTGFAVAVEGSDYKATPAGSNGLPTSLAAPLLPGLRAEDIPPSERAACFFCSRPARITDLTPVEIAIDGKRRKVLACTDDVRIIQQGATPQIRTVTVNGRPAPWYSAPLYDPYRDYARTEVVYAPAYGGYYEGDGFAEGLLLGSLLSPPIYPAPYPIFVTPDGDYTSSFADAAPPVYDAGGPYDAGGVDFGGNDPGVGGVDFGGADAGGVDFGGGDSGSDFGGSDFGGSDSGSDFSSGDSGGGGDY